MKESVEATDIDGGTIGTAGWAAIASVALALYYYYVRGDKQRGQFVGLWPATILGLATYRKVQQNRQQLDAHDHE